MTRPNAGDALEELAQIQRPAQERGDPKALLLSPQVLDRAAVRQGYDIHLLVEGPQVLEQGQGILGRLSKLHEHIIKLCRPRHIDARETLSADDAKFGELLEPDLDLVAQETV